MHCFNDLLQNRVVQKDLLIIIGFINRFKRIIRNGIIIHRQEGTLSLGDRRIAAVPVRAHEIGIPVITCVILALVIMDGLDDDALILTGIGSLVSGFSGFVQQTDLHCPVKDIQRRDVIAVLVLLDTDAEAGTSDSHGSLRRTYLVGRTCGKRLCDLVQNRAVFQYNGRLIIRRVSRCGQLQTGIRLHQDVFGIVQYQAYRTVRSSGDCIAAFKVHTRIWLQITQ